jgi:prepilin-type N-terminal cleavage/methylation domain-containing protein
MKLVNKQAGFTIVELLIVVVVIAILAAITIVSFNGIQTRARDSARDSAVHTIRTALENYANINGGVYPNACGTASFGCDSSKLSSSLTPDYINSVPPDPTSGATIDYVVSTGFGGYALYIKYEAKPACKIIVGKNTNSAWWGVSVPQC